MPFVWQKIMKKKIEFTLHHKNLRVKASGVVYTLSPHICNDNSTVEIFLCNIIIFLYVYILTFEN